MKNKIIQTIGLFIFLFSIGNLCAQVDNNEAITIPLSNPGKDGKLKISLLYGSITVVAHSRQDVIIQTMSSEKSKSEKTRDGMRKIGDTSLEFSIEEYNNNVVVKSKKVNKRVDFKIFVPKNFSLNLRAINNGNILVEGVKGELEISNLNGAISLVKVGGSVIADALNKDIIVTLDEVYENTPMAFTSLNGDIDISFPVDLKANIKAKTDNGEMYADYEIKMTRDVSQNKKRSSSGVYKVTVDKWVTGTINGGGAELLFKTMNGDIMIRSN